jgi:hypothetical protein
MRVKTWLLLLLACGTFAGLNAATRVVMCEDFYMAS